VNLPHYQPASKQTASAGDFLPKRRSLASLRAAALCCKGCDLYKNASQTVFGEGPRKAQVVLVGEQPGDVEDRQGRPIVGPAGRILDKALAEARIPREEVYVTNAVKHFKFIQRGKRRMHQKPLIRQVISCHPWLQAELATARPKMVVCLGATATQSILKRLVRVIKERGKFFDGYSGTTVFITIHPSAIYRRRGEGERREEYRQFVADLKLVYRRLHSMEE
jgi:uracil-DNA glycosylase family protein